MEGQEGGKSEPNNGNGRGPQVHLTSASGSRGHAEWKQETFKDKAWQTRLLEDALEGNGSENVGGTVPLPCSTLQVPVWQASPSSIDRDDVAQLTGNSQPSLRLLLLKTIYDCWRASMYGSEHVRQRGVGAASP